MDNVLGNNIRQLRRFFGETQLELAAVLEVDSPSTVSNYESGLRIPERQVLEKLAAHYRLTVDALTGTDLSGLGELRLQNTDWAETGKLLRALLPLSCSVDALADPDFRLAYETQDRLLESAVRRERVTPADRSAAGLYRRVLKERFVPEAAGNLCIQLFLNWLTRTAPSGGADKNGSFFFSMLKAANTRDPEMEEHLSPEEEAALESLRAETDGELCALLRQLHAEPGWADFTEWCTVLRWLTGIAEKDTCRSTELRAAGRELFSALCLLGNRYAVSAETALRELGID